MITGSELSFLHQWQNFYMLTGTTAATLTGLMFVVTTLFVGIDGHLSTLKAAVAAFNTPTVVNFGVVLVLAGILSAPWDAYLTLGFPLGFVGLGMIFYLSVVMRRMRRVPNYQSTLEDWSWYLGLPLFASVSLIVAAFMLLNNPVTALYIVSLSILLFLLVGIRNAWDMVTFLAVERAHGRHDHPINTGDVPNGKKPTHSHSK